MASARLRLITRRSQVRDLLYKTQELKEKRRLFYGLRFFISLPFYCCNRAATGTEFIDIMDRTDVASGNF
jgi:hypothetical protein